MENPRRGLRCVLGFLIGFAPGFPFCLEPLGFLGVPLEPCDQRVIRGWFPWEPSHTGNAPALQLPAGRKGGDLTKEASTILQQLPKQRRSLVDADPPAWAEDERDDR